jgi:hypothetical protein
VNDWFDVFNSRNPNESLPIKKPFSNSPEQRRVLHKMETAIMKMRVGSTTKLFPFQRGMIMSIYSLRDLYSALHEEFGIDYLMTCRLNQDYIENAFSMIRKMGAYNDNPTPVDAQRRLKLLMLSWGGNTSVSKGSPVEAEDNEPFLTGRMLKTLIGEVEPKPDPPVVQLSEWDGERYELNEGNMEEIFKSMGIVQTCETYGKEYVFGFVASKYSQKQPELIASNEERIALSSNSWVQTLSEGGLTVPSLSWRNQCETLYNEFRVLHQGNDHEISRSPGVMVGFSNALIEKYPTFPQAPLRKFIKTLTHIRIKAANQKIVEERKEKHRQIQLRIAQRYREREAINVEQNNEEAEEMDVDGEYEEVDEEMDMDAEDDEEEPETIRYNADHAILASFNEYMEEESRA